MARGLGVGKRALLRSQCQWPISTSLKVRADPLKLQAPEKLARQVRAQVSNRREQRQSALPLALAFRETDLPVKGGSTRKNDKNTQPYMELSKKSGT